MRSPLDDEPCLAVGVWPGSGPGGCRSPCSSRWSSERFPGTCWSRSGSPTHCPSRSSFPPGSDSLAFLKTQTESPGYKHPGRRVAQLIKESHIYGFFKLMLNAYVLNWLAKCMSVISNACLCETISLLFFAGCRHIIMIHELEVWSIIHLVRISV